jgi:hypothetical protein
MPSQNKNPPIITEQTPTPKPGKNVTFNETVILQDFHKEDVALPLGGGFRHNLDLQEMVENRRKVNLDASIEIGINHKAIDEQEARGNTSPIFQIEDDTTEEIFQAGIAKAVAKRIEASEGSRINTTVLESLDKLKVNEVEKMDLDPAMEGPEIVTEVAAFVEVGNTDSQEDKLMSTIKYPTDKASNKPKLNQPEVCNPKQLNVHNNIVAKTVVAKPVAEDTIKPCIPNTVGPNTQVKKPVPTIQSPPTILPKSNSGTQEFRSITPGNHVMARENNPAPPSQHAKVAQSCPIMAKVDSQSGILEFWNPKTAQFAPEVVDAILSSTNPASKSAPNPTPEPAKEIQPMVAKKSPPEKVVMCQPSPVRVGKGGPGDGRRREAAEALRQRQEEVQARYRGQEQELLADSPIHGLLDITLKEEGVEQFDRLQVLQRFRSQSPSPFLLLLYFLLLLLIILLPLPQDSLDAESRLAERLAGAPRPVDYTQSSFFMTHHHLMEKAVSPNGFTERLPCLPHGWRVRTINTWWQYYLTPDSVILKSPEAALEHMRLSLQLPPGPLASLASALGLSKERFDAYLDETFDDCVVME